MLGRLELVRINDEVLASAGALLPADLRSLDAIHLATALLFGASLRQLVTYDARMSVAATTVGLRVVSPV